MAAHHRLFCLVSPHSTFERVYLDGILLGPCPIGGSECLNLITSPKPKFHRIWLNNSCQRILFVSKFQIQEKEFQAAIWVGEMKMSCVRDIINLIPVGGQW